MFDQFVAGRRPRNTRRRMLMLVSVILHGGAGLGLGIYSFFHVEEIAPPVTSVTFFAVPPPPPPPPPPAGHRSERPKTVDVKPKQVVQPTEIPHTIQQPQKQEEAKDDSDEGGEPGGVEGGVKGGVAGGVVGGTLGGVVGGQIASTAPPPPPLKPKNVPPHLLDAQAVYRPEPHLPDAVKLQRKGTGDSVFVAKLCVAQDGSMMRVDVMQGIPGADESITSTIRQWRYKPQPIPVCFIANFVFTLL
jgi:periplasmic protein TonB